MAGTALNVHLGEVSAYGCLKMQCLSVAGTSTECLQERMTSSSLELSLSWCLLTRGIRLWEVSVSGGSTVIIINCNYRR